MTLNILSKKLFMELPDAVIFDTDNTLYPYEPAHKAATISVKQKASKLLGVKPEIFEDALSQSRREVKNRLGDVASSHSRLLYFQRAIELLGMKTQLLITLDLEQTYWRTFLENCKLFDSTITFLKHLKELEIKTAIITDLTAQIQFRKIIFFGLEDYFDFVVTSEESGMDKPNKNSFDLALKKLKVNPKKCWMIGDSIKSDISGANAKKIISIQKVHKGVKIDDKQNIPDARITEFSSLIDLIYKLS